MKVISYEISYGPVNENMREKKIFTNKKKAIGFFNEKQKQGLYVDAYQIETVVTKKKITE